VLTAVRGGSKLLISARRRASDRRLVFVVVVVTALARQVDLARPSTRTAHDIAITKCDAGREWMFDPALVKNVAGAGQQRNMLPERQEFAMAVLVIFRAKGNSQDLLARYDATLADAIATAPARPEALFAPPLGTGS